MKKLLSTVAAAAIAAVVLATAAAAESTGNQVSFRGGWAGLVHDRGSQVFTDVNGANGTNNGHGGYYIGGALDLLLTRDLWGMAKDVWAQGEVGLEYKRFNSKNVRSATNALTGIGSPNSVVPITMLTVDVSPKLRYGAGERFQPWIIPVGLDFVVVSPPSNQAGYLDVGVQFGVGADYRVWKELKVGADARYHVAAGNTGTQNNFGTVGAYLGIGF